MANVRARGGGQRPLPADHETRAIWRVGVDGARAEDSWGIAAETPIEINLNGRPLAVMMATPRDLEDLAVGFCLTETVLTRADAVSGVDVQILPEGVVADVTADAGAVEDSRIRPRFLEGVSGCGLCGVERLADAIRDVRGPAAPGERPDADAVLAAFDALPGAQALNRATRSVHGAALAGMDGRLTFAREDVGRHNALDKLIGARARAGAADAPGFVVMSSRCSFELVQKCAVAGIGFLATVSAPTGLALALARAAGIGIACLDKGALIEFETA